jgi:hypothetical protein
VGSEICIRDRGSPAKAVIFGVLVDIVGSTLAAFLIMLAYGIALAASGASAEEIERAATKVDPTSWVSIAGFAVGCAFSFLGGYVCARVVRDAELKWASVVAAISVASGFLLGMQAYSIALNVLLAILGAACVLLGGYVGARRNATNK